MTHFWVPIAAISLALVAAWFHQEARWALLGIATVGAIIWGFEQIPGPGPPPPLPPHVRVGPNGTFFTDMNYYSLGAVLCKEGQFSVHTFPEGRLITCQGGDNKAGPHAYTYPKSKLWRP